VVADEVRTSNSKPKTNSRTNKAKTKALVLLRRLVAEAVEALDAVVANKTRFRIRTKVHLRGVV
jgi:hypothetical protein